jgi:hypothetical protein
MAVAAANPVLLQHWSAWLAVEKDSFSVPKAGLDVANPSLGL